jgi:6-phosphogluconolactonase
MLNGGKSRIDIHPFDSLNEVATQTAASLENGRVALSGGSTYMRLFAYWLVCTPRVASTSFFPVDERVVAFESPQSNWGEACRRFFAPLGVVQARKRHVTSAQQYRDMLAGVFDTMPPVFDTVFLGVGEDGHTASLFPGMPCLDDHESVVVETRSPRAPFERVSLAPRVLAAARQVIVVVAGARKEKAVAGICHADASLPIVKVCGMRMYTRMYIGRELLHDRNMPHGTRG